MQPPSVVLNRATLHTYSLIIFQASVCSVVSVLCSVCVHTQIKSVVWPVTPCCVTKPRVVCVLCLSQTLAVWVTVRLCIVFYPG